MLREVIAAYETTVLNPCQDEYYIARPGQCLCCPLTALALAEGAVRQHDPRLGHVVYSWAVARYGKSWVLGFQDGWDWRWPGPAAPVNDFAYQAGFEAGKAMFKALILSA